MNIKNPKVNRNGISPRRLDAYGIRINKGKVIIDIGTYNKNENQIDVTSSHYIRSDELLDLVVGLVKAGMAYEIKYKENIGFSFEKE